MAFAGLLCKRIGAPGIMVMGDGPLAERRGSITVDDEGTLSVRTVMIEEGVLTKVTIVGNESATDPGDWDFRDE